MTCFTRPVLVHPPSAPRFSPANVAQTRSCVPKSSRSWRHMTQTAHRRRLRRSAQGRALATMRADDQRFLVNTLTQDAAATPITLVVNWPAGTAEEPLTSSAPNFRNEPVHPPAAVFGNVDVALRIDGDPVRLVELPGKVSWTSEVPDDLSGFAVDHLDLRVVLVDDEEEALVGRKVDRHG